MGTVIGIFTTLTGEGSRSLVDRVLRSCVDGGLEGVTPAFVLVNRGLGEDAVTDASAAALAAAHDVPFIRVSAVGFEPELRRAARARAAAGDPAALTAWRDAWWASFAHRLPSADVDLCLGDMWIWGPDACAARCGLNLHPSLPDGPLGKMWFEVIWELVAAGADASGVMIHRVTPAVDQGPVAAWCRYPLTGGALDAAWATLPPPGPAREALVAAERARGRASDHPLFRALRAAGLAREIPLLLATVQAVADGRLRPADLVAVDGDDRPPVGGIDLSDAVEAAVSASGAA